LKNPLLHMGRAGLALPGGLTEADRHRVQRIDPRDPATDTIGFFVASFRKA
jgi:hypothetical protein